MNIRKLPHLFFGCCLLLTLAGCEVLDKPEQIPAYIHISSISLIENPVITQGTLSNKIVDAWIYIDDQLVGAFELPCTFPVLLEGKHTIAVYAGIYLNGVRTTRVDYPFYAPFTQDVTLAPGRIDTIKPVVAYNNNIKLPFHENFELGGVLLEDDLKSLTSLHKTNDSAEIFEGNYAGKIVLNDTDSVYIGVSILPFQLPTAGGHVFLELDYKSEADIIIGLYAIKSSQILQLDIAGVLPRDQWSKIYINLTPTVYRNNDALEWKLFIGSYLPDGKSEATVLIDNLKLIHF
jgi:hypothetical protein